VECEYVSNGRGSEKRCWVRYDELVFQLDSPPQQSSEDYEELAMPVGLFTAANVQPTCGIASSQRVIGFLDNPQSFLLPARADAQVLWFARGWVEFTFPCDLPSTAEVTGLEFAAEICSEAPNYENDWPSDITVWMNGVEVGTWTSPGDFGGRRGRLNPDWWSDSLTQYGSLKSFSVDATGGYVDGTAAAGVCLSDLGLAYGKPIVVRIGVKPDAVHKGGVNLMGQDPLLRIRYRIRAHRQSLESSESIRSLAAGTPGGNGR